MINNRRQLLCLLGLLAAAAGSLANDEATEFDEPGSVALEGEWIVYSGHVHEDLNRQARELYQQNPGVRGIRISSPGGVVDYGLELGEWMLEHQLDVYVDRDCYSSCANYVFLAGVNKILATDALVGWHGSTRQWQDVNDMCDSVRTERSECRKLGKALREREDAFFKALGLSPLIPVIGLADGANYRRVGRFSSWTYSLETMQALGIGGIAVDGQHWRPQDNPTSKVVCRLDIRTLKCLAIK